MDFDNISLAEFYSIFLLRFNLDYNKNQNVQCGMTSSSMLNIQRVESLVECYTGCISGQLHTSKHVSRRIFEKVFKTT